MVTSTEHSTNEIQNNSSQKQSFYEWEIPIIMCTFQWWMSSMSILLKMASPHGKREFHNLLIVLDDRFPIHGATEV